MQMSPPRCEADCPSSLLQAFTACTPLSNSTAASQAAWTAAARVHNQCSQVRDMCLLMPAPKGVHCSVQYEMALRAAEDVLLQGTTGASWGGSLCATDATSFAAEAAKLYNAKDLWNACQQQGYTLLQRLYDADANLAVVRVSLLCGEPHQIYRRVTSAVLCLQEAIFAKQERREWWRAQDFTGQMLWSQQLRATEFFSRWIELKESRPPT